MPDARDVLDVLRTTLTTAFEVPDDLITADATLEDLELDSLALAEFGLILQERLGVKVDGEQVTKSTTLADIAGIVQAHLDGTVAVR